MKKDLLNKNYTHFSLKNLKYILKNKPESIIKILEMNYIAISEEIEEIHQSVQDKNMEVIKRKAHNLKTKLGYLNMLEEQENARKIELYASQENIEHIRFLLGEIDEHWQKAKLEIAELLGK